MGAGAVCADVATGNSSFSMVSGKAERSTAAAA